VAQSILTRSAQYPLDTATGFRGVLSAASSGGGLVVLIGIVLMAGEFRFNTITATLLATPDRRRLLGAKLLTGSLVGAAVGFAASILAATVALPWLAARGVGISGHLSDIVSPVVGGVVATGVYGALGVAIGALLTNQTLAITIALLWSLFVEGLVVGFVPALGRWLPGGAASALGGVITPKGGLLAPWAAGLVLAAYAVAFAVAGARALERRDVA
jgi:ABC-2 type transport system permease protein